MAANESARPAPARPMSPQSSSVLSMRELLASCDAATAVSTPPPAPAPRPYGPEEQHREAA
ncbi:hypothetical protein [Streptomyces sp. enrichment culture]|uniref:hypothetical protein n=1 Tax=Streptomyces sp. enrichment culture TaxID=1795815 RepID=UPI003F55F537